MGNPYRQEQIESWVGDFCDSPACRSHAPLVREYAPEVLVSFLAAACARRDVDPSEIEQSDLRPALLDGVGALEIPGSVRGGLPDLVCSFLEALETQGRLGGGFTLAGYARVLKREFLDRVAGVPKPYVAPSSKLGRNDPCPCGSGLKYKKCCMNRLDG